MRKKERRKVGAEAPPIFFQPPHRNFEPPFNPPFFQKFTATVQPHNALQQWLIASLVIRFFSSLIKRVGGKGAQNFFGEAKKI